MRLDSKSAILNYKETVKKSHATEKVRFSFCVPQLNLLYYTIKLNLLK